MPINYNPAPAERDSYFRSLTHRQQFMFLTKNYADIYEGAKKSRLGKLAFPRFDRLVELGQADKLAQFGIDPARYAEFQSLVKGLKKSHFQNLASNTARVAIVAVSAYTGYGALNAAGAGGGAGIASTAAQEAAHAGVAGGIGAGAATAGAGATATSSLSNYARYAELGLNALSSATQISAAKDSKKAGLYEQELTLRRQASERRQLIRDLYITRASSIAAAASNDEGALQSSSPIAANTSIFSQGAFNIKYFDAQAESERLYKKYLNKASGKQETAGALAGVASIIGAFNQGS